MSRFPHPTRRTRLRLTLLAVLALLFQQVALASYACAIADVPAGHTTMSTPCDGMPMTQQEQNPVLCAVHCAQQTPTPTDVHAPTVPPLLLPALLPAPVVLTMLPTTRTAYGHAAAWRSPGIAPALRFRVLLI